MRTSEPGFDRAFLRPESERRGSAVGVFTLQRLARTSHASVVASRCAHAGGPEEIFPTSRWPLGGHSARRSGRRANGGGLREAGGAAGVGMRVRLVSAKLNVSQILLRTQSGVDSHIRGCL